MKRSPMPQRKAPMRIRPGSFGVDLASRPDRSAEFESFTPERRASILRLCSATTRPHVSVPKVVPVRHEGYRRLVALLPCLMCGIEGYSQCAHANQNKGMSAKSDDRFTFPLCAPRPGAQGCHALFDQGAMFPKEQRRISEARWARWTRERLRQIGCWPHDLEWVE